MRGRLIFAFLAELHRLDTLATATTPPGYDDDFKELALLDTGDAIGERVRREHAPVLLPCQVESDAFEALQSFAAGFRPLRCVPESVDFGTGPNPKSRDTKQRVFSTAGSG